MIRIKLGIGLLILVVCAVGVLSVGATHNAQANAAGSSKEEDALRAADIAWSEAAGRKDVEAVVAYMADDGETLPPNEPAQRDKAAIKAGWTGLLSLPGVSIGWKPNRVQVASSGDLGCTSGTYTLSFTGPDGKPVNDHGKYLEVWKKIDGKWKCTSDMYSSDLPAK